MRYRTALPEDFDRIVTVVDDWWGRPVSHAIPRLFLDHFHSTSFVVEDEGKLVGFLVGFISPSKVQEAYIHFVGVDPAKRELGIAASLYQRFFELSRNAGCTKISAITAPVNEGSIKFHRKMGFTASEPIEGYNQPGKAHVVFKKMFD